MYEKFYKRDKASYWAAYIYELTYIKNIKFAIVIYFGKYFILDLVRINKKLRSSIVLT